MKATPTNVIVVCLALSGLLVLVIVAGLLFGSVQVNPRDVFDWFRGDAVSRPAAIILGELRSPRILLAALVGIALSLSGSVFQSVLRNPLCDPFILGISGGAAVGAIIAMTFALGGPWRPILAFAGAVLTVFFVPSIARRQGRMETGTLILTGVMVNAFFSALIMYVIATSRDEKLHSILFWLYGNLSEASMVQIYILFPVVLGCSVFVFFHGRHLNLLSAGDMAAASLGIEVERVKMRLFILISLLVGVTVAFSGLIGFVGLIIPHLVRNLLGQDYRLLIPASALLGAVFLVGADTVARTVISPSSLPVGVVTATFGAPFFLFLLAKRGSRW